jgi:hypothetical protein
VCSSILAVEMLALAMKFSKTHHTHTHERMRRSQKNNVRSLKAAQDANTHQPDHHEGHTPKGGPPTTASKIGHATSQRSTEKTSTRTHERGTRRGSLQKGGDPAAPSGTATLLRLRPNRRSHLRRLPPKRVRPPASGVTDFHDVTGGVYKARERIHRGVADPRLLATPTSRSRVADSDPN